jgi:Tol biopolymer transport system component
LWTRAVVGAAIGALAGCGRVTDKAGLAADAATDAASDAAGDARPARCNPVAAFGKPVALTSLNTTAHEEHADLSADELTIYFSSTRPDGAGGFDIYEATRTSTSTPFGNIMSVPGVNTAADERAPRMAVDGLSMFANVKTSTSGFHIALATRSNVTVAFSGLKMVANVNGATNDADPYLVSGGKVMYLTSDLAGNFGLYRSVMVNGVFSTPSPVPGVNLDTASIENNPVVTPDELTLIFGSNRPGGTGDYDMYEARRASVADGFGAPIALTGLNTTGSDDPTWISPDGCNLYFIRVDPTLGFQIFMASRGH